MRRTARALLITAVAAALSPAPALAASGSSPAVATVDVIVRAASVDAAAAAVRGASGSVTRTLPIVDGVAARVPARALDEVATAPDVRVVTANAEVRMAEAVSTEQTNTVNHVLNREIGADELRARGLTGKGVRVALVDTGISPVGDLAGRVVRVDDPHNRLSLTRRAVDCVDFSGENSCVDSYGHGTFMAGLIAGNGAASDGRFAGVAPGAELVSIKIAGRDGSADVSKVLAAIQWAVSFKDRYGIRVLNLSLGTNSTASTAVDPLNFAVQRAWRSGIVVVVAASNRGPDAGTISKPADDPLVLTVGAVDDRETPAISDDRVPHFSGRGPTVHGLAKPDVVAPGGRVISLRSPGSFVEQMAPGGGIDATYRRGSGTSMSAAIVSGLTALVLQAQPAWTPDRVKYAFASTAHKVGVDDRLSVGAGLVNGPAALAAGPGLANQAVTGLSDATGSIDDSRGDVRVQGDCRFDTCLPVGDDTTQDRPLNDFDAGQYRGDWTGSSWYSSQWVNPLGSSWYATRWYQNLWQGSSWYGSSWYGNVDETFYGSSFAGSSWYGAWE